MKVVQVVEPGRAELADASDPKASGQFAVVKILCASMCTEYKQFQSGKPMRHIGHEAAGEVVEIAQAGPVKPGDRVVVMPQYPCGVCELCLSGEYIHCEHTIDLEEATGQKARSTYAQYMLKQDWLLAPIPGDVPIEHGAMACCGLGPTFGAMQRMAVNAFDTVLITGMGPVGLGGVINAVARGARAIAVESHPWRAALALELGATAAIDPADPGAARRIRELTGGKGADKAIDCSGVAAAQRLLIDSARRKGQIAFVGEGAELSIQISRDMLRKGLTLIGSWHYNRADVPLLMRLIRQQAALLDKQITHLFPMREVQKAWELQATGECGKVILKPWE